MAPARLSYVWKVPLTILASVLVFGFVLVPIGLWLARVTESALGAGAGIAARIALLAFVGLFCWSVIMAAGWKRTIVGTACVLLAIGGWWIYETAVWRDAEYRRVIDGFQRATAYVKNPGPKSVNGGSGWDEGIALANGITANLVARDHLDIATLRYSDEASRRELFPYRDYTNITSLRRRGMELYILRTITLLRVEYRMAIYDLAHREVVADRRINPSDLR